MSEDPKLFDAGDYNLFRYCHNDPIDFTDPMGLSYGSTAGQHLTPEVMHAMDKAYNFIMGLTQRQFSSAISAGMAGLQAYQASQNFIMGQVRSSQSGDGSQYRYSKPQGHQQHRTPLKEGGPGAEFHWQLN